MGSPETTAGCLVIDDCRSLRLFFFVSWRCCDISREFTRVYILKYLLGSVEAIFFVHSFSVRCLLHCGFPLHRVFFLLDFFPSVHTIHICVCVQCNMHIFEAMAIVLTRQSWSDFRRTNLNAVDLESNNFLFRRQTHTHTKLKSV